MISREAALSSNPNDPFDGLLPDATSIDWHIKVRCRSGFDGQLPIPQDLVPDAEVVAAITVALEHGGAQIVALVGSAGTGKTTALGFLLREFAEAGRTHVRAFRCGRRTVGDIHAFLGAAARDADPKGKQLLVLDGIDEIAGDAAPTCDEFLAPVLDQIADGRIKIVMSVRAEDVGRPLLVPPAPDLVNTLEWFDAWSGVRTRAGLRIAILRLQELRPSDVTLYARRRGLEREFVQHLRGLYDLRELVRRFFLLVRLCDLSAQLNREHWMAIRDRNTLYRQLLTAWLAAERLKHPGRLPLEAHDLLPLLGWLAVQLPSWSGPCQDGRPRLRVAPVMLERGSLTSEDAELVAAALARAAILDENGFSHKSIEEFLLAQSLADFLMRGHVEPIPASRITNDVVSFLAENENLRTWLDLNQADLGRLRGPYAPIMARLLHRQGRSVSGLDLREVDFSGLELSGMQLRGADLRGADLSTTDLGPVDLSGADLRGAVLTDASVWSGEGADALYPSGSSDSGIWVERRGYGSNRRLALLRVGVRTGRVAYTYPFDQKAIQMRSDGKAMYALSRVTSAPSVEAVRLVGEHVAPENFWMPGEGLPLFSHLMPGAVWHIRGDAAILYDDAEIVKTHAHPNASVLGVMVASRGLKPFGIDGVCILGESLWTVGPEHHQRLADAIPWRATPDCVVAVGDTRVLFRNKESWNSWLPASNTVVTHPELADVTRVVSTDRGFILVKPAAVIFTDSELSEQVTKTMDTRRWRHIAAISRQKRRALAVLTNDPLWLTLVDEEDGVEQPEWIRMRAADARFDASTRIDGALRTMLLGAGARDVSVSMHVAALGEAISSQVSSQVSSPGLPPLPTDVVLLTVNDIEWGAVMDVARRQLGREPTYDNSRSRTYHDLETRSGARVRLVNSQMGSSTPGGSQATATAAINELQPRWIIAVGIAFGIDRKKQPVGRILFSKQLQMYELQRVSTIDGVKKIVPRGDKVTPNPTFLDLMTHAGRAWERERGEKPDGIVMLSGEKLVDNVDYRKELIDLFPEAKGGEMEGTGLYSASRERETRWMVIKAVSDYADGHKGKKKEERQQAAASRAAEFVFFMLDRGGFAARS